MRHRALTFAAAFCIAACSSASNVGTPTVPTVAPSSSAAPSAAPVAPTPSAHPAQPSIAPIPTPFTSTLYHYSLVLPAGWNFTPATVPWDGTYQYGHGEPQTDLFVDSTSSRAAWGMAAPTSLKLAAYARDRIAANKRDHGDTCPADPSVTQTTAIDGVNATFIAWDCGIEINFVVVVHAGIGYVFGLRDPAVHAATDAADRAAFDQLLGTVKLPD